MTQTESAILAHARRCAPAESCGFVVSTPEGERYFPCVNISGEPEAYFRMSPEDWLQAEMQGEIVALVHSHPGGLPWLSEADRRLQVQSDLPWWLVCRGTIHKFRCVPHLTGRRFEHGVTDCYTLFRDAYHLAGIEMPDFHREDDWWRNGQNLYLDNLEATGLLETQTVDFSVGAEGLRHVPGDVIEICDDDYAGISIGGRVLAVNSQTRTLTLDREITLPSSGTTLILVLIRTPLRLAHMDTPSPLTLLVTRKTPSKTSHLTIL